MRERFGQKTGSICLESGDLVSALLPMPGSPIQAMYFG